MPPALRTIRRPHSLEKSLAFAAGELKILRPTVPAHLTALGGRLGVVVSGEALLAMMKTFLNTLAFVIGFGSPASAWDLAPLSSCFEAMELGSIVSNFSREQWSNPLTHQFYFETEHVWVFYRGEFFDLYYETQTPGPSAAYCEVKRLYPGEGQPG